MAQDDNSAAYIAPYLDDSYPVPMPIPGTDPTDKAHNPRTLQLQPATAGAYLIFAKGSVGPAPSVGTFAVHCELAATTWGVTTTLDAFDGYADNRSFSLEAALRVDAGANVQVDLRCYTQGTTLPNQAVLSWPKLSALKVDDLLPHPAGLLVP